MLDQKIVALLNFRLNCFVSEPNLQNAGKYCIFDCDFQAGQCQWCGSNGWCCMKDWIENGCDGSFGGENFPACVLKP